MTLPSATEYFVSYYDCPRFLDDCEKAVFTGHKCLERPGKCPNWPLRYRCRLGNLNEKGLEYFEQNSGINPEDYPLQSINDLALDSLEKINEHVQAREDFERLPEWGCRQDETLHMRGFIWVAEKIMKLQYGEVSAPHFVDSEIASIFYKMETDIIKNATRWRIEEIIEEKARGIFYCQINQPRTNNEPCINRATVHFVYCTVYCTTQVSFSSKFFFNP